MADAVRALEGAEPVLIGDLGRVPEILDQLERAAEREHLCALDLLDLGGEAARVAGIAQPIAEGVGRGLRDLDGLGAKLGQAVVDLALPLPDLLADMMVLGQVLGFGELQPHDVFSRAWMSRRWQSRSSSGPRCRKLSSIAVISLPTLVAPSR